MSQYLPMKIGRGTDFRGIICGQPPLQHRPYQYWLLPQIDKNLKMCVQSCPEQSGPAICLYEPDGHNPTTFCYQSMATNRQGLYCLPRQYNSQMIIRKLVQQPLLALERYLSDFLRTLPSYLFSLILTFLFSTLIKTIKSALYPHFMRSILSLTQTALVFFCVMSYMDYQQQLSSYCIDSIDKYSCLTPYHRVVLGLYVTLLVVYFLVCAFQWNTINKGSKIISQNELLSRIISKIGFSIYLHAGGMFLLLSFCIFVCYCILSLYGKQQLPGVINGGILYTLLRDANSGVLFAAATICIVVCILTYLTMIRVNIILAVSIWKQDKMKENNLLFQSLWSISRYRLGSVCKHALMMPLRIIVVCSRGRLRSWLDRISLQNFMSSEIQPYSELADKTTKSAIPQCVQTTTNHLCFSLAVISSCLQLIVNRYWLHETVQFSLSLSILIIPLSYLFFQSIWTRYPMCYTVIHNQQN